MSVRISWIDVICEKGLMSNGEIDLSKIVSKSCLRHLHFEQASTSRLMFSNLELIMFSKRLCYEFVNCRRKCRKIFI